MLDELVRVLAPGGLLLISSPNRGVYPDNNPHHPHELTAVELRELLEARLRHVRLMRQHDYIVSAVLSDAGYAKDGAEAMSAIVAGQARVRRARRGALHGRASPATSRCPSSASSER